MTLKPLSEASRYRYERAWMRFEDWCEKHDLTARPAEPSTAVRYVAELSGATSASAVRLAKAAIERFHLEEGHPSPFGAIPPTATLSDLTETGEVPDRSGTVVLDRELPRELVAMIEAQPPTLTGLRDRVVLMLGAGARLQVVELRRLQIGDVRVEPGAVTVRLPEGGEVTLTAGTPSFDPSSSVGEWTAHLANKGYRTGPVIRAIHYGKTILDKPPTKSGFTLIVERAAELAGLPGAESYSVSVLRAWGAAQRESMPRREDSGVLRHRRR